MIDKEKVDAEVETNEREQKRSLPRKNETPCIKANLGHISQLTNPPPDPMLSCRLSLLLGSTTCLVSPPQAPLTTYVCCFPSFPPIGLPASAGGLL